MTVGELIDILQNAPSEWPVRVEAIAGDTGEIVNVAARYLTPSITIEAHPVNVERTVVRL